MKKKNLKSLSLNKKSISNLHKVSVVGGDEVPVPPTGSSCYSWCCENSVGAGCTIAQQCDHPCPNPYNQIEA